MMMQWLEVPVGIVSLLLIRASISSQNLESFKSDSVIPYLNLDEISED